MRANKTIKNKPLFSGEESVEAECHRFLTQLINLLPLKHASEEALGKNTAAIVAQLSDAEIKELRNTVAGDAPSMVNAFRLLDDTQTAVVDANFGFSAWLSCIVNAIYDEYTSRGFDIPVLAIDKVVHAMDVALVDVTGLSLNNIANSLISMANWTGTQADFLEHVKSYLRDNDGSVVDRSRSSQLLGMVDAYIDSTPKAAVEETVAKAEEPVSRSGRLLSVLESRGGFNEILALYSNEFNLVREIECLAAILSDLAELRDSGNLTATIHREEFHEITCEITECLMCGALDVVKSDTHSIDAIMERVVSRAERLRGSNRDHRRGRRDDDFYDNRDSRTRRGRRDDDFYDNRDSRTRRGRREDARDNSDISNEAAIQLGHFFEDQETAFVRFREESQRRFVRLTERLGIDERDLSHEFYRGRR